MSNKKRLITLIISTIFSFFLLVCLSMSTKTISASNSEWGHYTSAFNNQKVLINKRTKLWNHAPGSKNLDNNTKYKSKKVSGLSKTTKAKIVNSTYIASTKSYWVKVQISKHKSVWLYYGKANKKTTSSQSAKVNSSKNIIKPDADGPIINPIILEQIMNNGSNGVDNKTSSDAPVVNVNNDENTNNSVDDKNKKEVVTVNINGPISKGNMLLLGTKVEFKPGDTAFTVTKKACTENVLNLSYRGDGAGAYVSGISSYYEFSIGAGSGWLYQVNGEFPAFSCGIYSVKPGDTVNWLYTEDMGKDRGAPQNY